MCILLRAGLNDLLVKFFETLNSFNIFYVRSMTHGLEGVVLI